MNNLLKLYQSPLCGGVMICKDLLHNEAKDFFENVQPHMIFFSIVHFSNYSKVVSRSTCYYSGNQNFCLFKSRLLVNMAHFILETKLFLCQDRPMEFCEVSRNSKSKRYRKFPLSILANKKVLFLKKCD